MSATKKLLVGEHGESAKVHGALEGRPANIVANNGRVPANTGQELIEWDVLATPPKADPAMFYGPLGRLAMQAAQGTEVNPVAAMTAAISWFSACVGRNRIVIVGDDMHRLNVFTLHVGRTSRGGKGMALALVKRVHQALEGGAGSDGPAAHLRPQMHSGGLSSREGLAWLIHDEYSDSKDTFAGIDDKRLIVIETEFANVLAQGKRESNTLSTALRDVWDGVSIKPATKGSRVWATNPHIALHGCITPGELRTRIASNDLTNGFANRLLIVWAEREGCVPYPSRVSQEVVEAFAGEFGNIIRSGLAGYPDSDTVIPIQMDEQAQASYADCYREFRTPHSAGDAITGLLERRAPMLLRMAGLFAVADLVDEIRREHIEAAKAWMDYYTGSVSMIFAPTVDSEGEISRNENAEKLVAWLTACARWQTRTDIVRVCFQNHLPKQAIDAAIERLGLEGRIERRDVVEKGSKKRTEYRATVHSASEVARSSQPSIRPVIPDGTISSHVRNVREVEQSSGGFVEGEL